LLRGVRGGTLGLSEKTMSEPSDAAIASAPSLIIDFSTIIAAAERQLRSPVLLT
jgi:hypothetical protein